jgi:hypothetical protein
MANVATLVSLVKWHYHSIQPMKEVVIIKSHSFFLQQIIIDNKDKCIIVKACNLSSC